MDRTLQILKHLPRDARETVGFIDDYCQEYRDLFGEVRSYECFKALHLGIISPVARKSLPEIAKVVGIANGQSLHHFIAKSPWSVERLREKRLARIKGELGGHRITLIIDETGDRKKGKTTDYVSRQYLGNVGKVDRGIVTVNAYGFCEGICFPLKFKVFKPRKTLLEGDRYKTKIKLASELVEEIMSLGFKIELVLADSLYGEASKFLETLEKYQLDWVVAIRSNHGVWMPEEEKIRAGRWQKFSRTFSDETTEERYIREIIYGRRGYRSYWQMTTDPKTMPKNSTSFVMTNLQGKVRECLGDLYGLRTWVEYGFRQCKQELGWKDYRFTKYRDIERWWEIIFSAYSMVVLNCPQWRESNRENSPSETEEKLVRKVPEQWSFERGWKKTINNLRLLIQPTIMLWLILPWLEVFPNSKLCLGLQELIASVNQFYTYVRDG